MPLSDYNALCQPYCRYLDLAAWQITTRLLGPEKVEKRLLQQQFVPAPRLVGVEPNPGPPKSKRLSEEERWRVVHYSTLEHLSIRRIAQKMQISKTTVAQLLKKFQQTGISQRSSKNWSQEEARGRYQSRKKIKLLRKPRKRSQPLRSPRNLVKNQRMKFLWVQLKYPAQAQSSMARQAKGRGTLGGG